MVKGGDWEKLILWFSSLSNSLLMGFVLVFW